MEDTHDLVRAWEYEGDLELRSSDTDTPIEEPENDVDLSDVVFRISAADVEGIVSVARAMKTSTYEEMLARMASLDIYKDVAETYESLSALNDPGYGFLQMPARQFFHHTDGAKLNGSVLGFQDECIVYFLNDGEAVDFDCSDNNEFYHLCVSLWTEDLEAHLAAVREPKKVP